MPRVPTATHDDVHHELLSRAAVHVDRHRCRGRWVVQVAFVLAAAGLLDGRGATTHWMHADDLARRMHAELQAGPLDWLHQQRIARAQELLERTDASIEQIAVGCGMGTAATLRRHFHRTVGVTPAAYRASFRPG